MKIKEVYSHLNGLEYLMVRKKGMWKEIQGVIQSVDANRCKTKISKEKTMVEWHLLRLFRVTIFSYLCTCLRAGLG